MKRLILPILVFINLFSWAFLIEDTWQEKVEPALLEQVANGQSVEFLVILQSEADISAAANQGNKAAKGTYVYQQLQQNATQSQQAVVSILEQQNVLYKAYFIINMVYTQGDMNLIETLANLPEVKSIQTNPIAKVEGTIAADIASDALDTRDPDEVTWGIEMINADDVWAMGYTGQGVTVAGHDTGYEWEHPALKAKYRGWDGTSADHNYNWHDAIFEINELNYDADGNPTDNPCGLLSPFPCDDNSHGTHTMGTMIGADGTEEIGVAPGAKWMACRNMERGWGKLTTYVECFEFFLAPTDLNGENADPTKAPHVINNSWACPEIEGCNTDNFALMETAIDNLKAAGVVVVVSAGNNGDACSTVYNPASIFENSFTVGSTRSNDTISNFSSRGPVTVDGSNRMKPNVSAPGSGVRSAILNGEYGNKSGTSMAGPHVAGVVALIISANPSLAGDVEAIETIIENSAVDKMASQECGGVTGDNIPNNTYGHGRVDALAAVEMALAIVNVDDLADATPIRIFPNPFMDNLSFELPNIEGDISLELYNINGQIIHQMNWSANANQTQNVAIPNLPAGAYFYKLKHAKGEAEGKLMKL